MSLFLFIVSRILDMRETGLIDRWFDQYSPKDFCAYADKITGGQVATLSEVYGAILLLAVGLSCGIIFFLLELHMKSKRNILTLLRHTLARRL